VYWFRVQLLRCVATFQYGRDGLCMHRSGLPVAGIDDRTQELGTQAERVK